MRISMSRRQKRQAIETFIFTIPSVLMVTLVIYIPFVMSGYYSFTEWNGIAKTGFIGLNNLNHYVKERKLVNALIFTGKYTVLFMILSNVLALALAVVLVKKIKTANILRSTFFMPYIMSMTIVGFIWKFIFSQGFASLYEKTGLSFLNLSWLGDPKLAFYSVVFVGVWQSMTLPVYT